MSLKDELYAQELLHLVNSQKNAILFAEYVTQHKYNNFGLLKRKEKEKIYIRYLNKFK